MNVFNKSQIKIFEGHSLSQLEKEINAFMLTTNRIYNIKHTIEVSEQFTTIHYFMVSYE